MDQQNQTVQNTVGTALQGTETAGPLDQRLKQLAKELFLLEEKVEYLSGRLKPVMCPARDQPSDILPGVVAADAPRESRSFVTDDLEAKAETVRRLQKMVFSICERLDV
jgi:hypothetical protein